MRDQLSRGPPQSRPRATTTGPGEVDDSAQLRAINAALLASSIRQHELTQEAELDAARRRESEQRLAAELAATQALQRVSTRMIQEGDPAELHGPILDAAMVIMRADAAILQVLDPTHDRLQSVAVRGLPPEFAALLEVMRTDTKTACAEARRAGWRIIVPDVEMCEFLAGSSELEAYRRAGINAVQATPLLSRSGEFLGMLSTHWGRPRRPNDSSLHLMDVLARQAADLIERAQTEAALRESRAQMAIVTAELKHRVKNMLAVIQAVARQTLRHAPDMAAFQESFEARLQSIAAAHTLLTSTDWRGTTLDQIIIAEVGPRAAAAQLSARGPPVTLPPKQALAMHMIVHELTTNAVKYGGLQDETGRIDIRWAIEPDAGAGHAMFTLDWLETSPPSPPTPASPPSTAERARAGFGTRLITQLIEYELEGQVQQDYRPEGLHLYLRAPLETGVRVAARGEPPGA